MKKFLPLALLLIVIVSGCGKKPQPITNTTSEPAKPAAEKPVTDNQLIINADQAKAQVQNYFTYKFDQSELAKIKRSQTNDLYYYAADNKRYIFPNLDIFKSWFADYDITKFEQQTKDQLYKTPLGGNVFLRPGTIMQTPTDPNFYLIVSDGQIKTISQELIEQVYGADWEKVLVEIPNFYFTHYKNLGSLNAISNFPLISATITIDQDKKAVK